jgi:nucleoside-diphosphate-sugar epimerase
MPVALIAGATGLVGKHIAELLASQPGWRRIGLGRSRPHGPAAAHLDEFIAVDLADTRCVRQLGDRLSETTHVFYLSRMLGSGYHIPIDENVAMLGRLLDALDRADKLEHVQIMHGMKWYGSHVGAFPTPARESDPPSDSPSFYYGQRQLLTEHRQGRKWTYSTLRPHCVSGVATGSPSNLMLGLGVYGALMRETGRPLRYPGTARAFEARLTYTDAGLLARAMHWIATTPGAGDQDFNVANGDEFSWQELWPALADYFGVEAGPPGVADFVPHMHALEPVWRDLCRRHDLDARDYPSLVDWSFVRNSLALEWDQVMSTDKLARFGFPDQTSSPAMVFRILDEYRGLGLIPRKS